MFTDADACDCTDCTDFKRACTELKAGDFKRVCTELKAGDFKRACTELKAGEKNPLPHLGLEPASVLRGLAFQWDAVPTELSSLLQRTPSVSD